MPDQVEVIARRARPSDAAPFRYVFTGGTYCTVRVNGRRLSQPVVSATCVRANGHRVVLDCSVSDYGTEAFWAKFLTGFVAALGRIPHGSAPQRSGVHFLRNAQRGPRPARDLGDSLHVAHPPILATPWPTSPRSQTSPGPPSEDLEQLPDRGPGQRVKRRNDVVGTFPTTAALLRLFSRVLFEHHDAQRDTGRRYLSEPSKQLIFPYPVVPLHVVPAELAAA